MKFKYQTHYTPPIPTMEVYLKSPEEETLVGPFTAIVDTGADSTLIPTAYLTRLTITKVDEAKLRSHWGEWRLVALYMVDLQIVPNVTLPGIYVVGDDEGDEIILGRNALNKLYLILDGLKQTTEVKR